MANDPIVDELLAEMNKSISMNIFAHGVLQILVELFDMKGEDVDQIEIGFDEIKKSGIAALHIRLPITRNMARQVGLRVEQFNPAIMSWKDGKRPEL